MCTTGSGDLTCSSRASGEGREHVHRERHVLGGLRPATTAEDGIRGAVRAYMAWVRGDPVRGRFVYAASESTDLQGQAALVMEMKRGFLAEVGAWMAPHVESGAVRPLPSWAWDPVLFGPVHEVCRRRLAGAPIPFDDAVSVLEDVVWRAVGG